MQSSDTATGVGVIKIYDDFVNDQIKRRFSEDFVTVSDRQEKFVEI